jgi:hypothetical protein
MRGDDTRLPHDPNLLDAAPASTVFEATRPTGREAAAFRDSRGAAT